MTTETIETIPQGIPVTAPLYESEEYHQLVCKTRETESQRRFAYDTLYQARTNYNRTKRHTPKGREAAIALQVEQAKYDTLVERIRLNQEKLKLSCAQHRAACPVDAFNGVALTYLVWTLTYPVIGPHYWRVWEHVPSIHEMTESVRGDIYNWGDAARKLCPHDFTDAMRNSVQQRILTYALNIESYTRLEQENMQTFDTLVRNAIVEQAEYRRRREETKQVEAAEKRARYFELKPLQKFTLRPKSDWNGNLFYGQADAEWALDGYIGFLRPEKPSATLKRAIYTKHYRTSNALPYKEWYRYCIEAAQEAEKTPVVCLGYREYKQERWVKETTPVAYYKTPKGRVIAINCRQLAFIEAAQMYDTLSLVALTKNKRTIEFLLFEREGVPVATLSLLLDFQKITLPKEEAQ